MKKIFIIVAVSLISATSIFSQTKAGKQDNTRHTVLYSCPAHPKVIISDPATCPFCGMNLNLSLKEQAKLQISKAYSCPSAATFATAKQGKKLNVSLKEQMKMQVVRPNVNERTENSMDMTAACH